MALRDKQTKKEKVTVRKAIQDVATG